MKIVLVSGGNSLASEPALVFAQEQETDELSFVTWRPPTQQLRRACRHVVVLGPMKRPPEEPNDQKVTEPEVLTGLSIARVSAALEWRQRRLRRLARRKVGRARSLLGRDRAQAWRRVRREPTAMDLLAEADLVVALDSQAIRVGWEMSRRRPGVAAVWGIPAARVAAARLAMARSAVDVEQDSENDIENEIDNDL